MAPYSPGQDSAPSKHASSRSLSSEIVAVGEPLPKLYLCPRSEESVSLPEN